MQLKRQINYGRERGIPWGVSESGYNMVDVQLNYQYRAFGVPGLGQPPGEPAFATLNLTFLSSPGHLGDLGQFLQ